MRPREPDSCGRDYARSEFRVRERHDSSLRGKRHRSNTPERTDALKSMNSFSRYDQRSGVHDERAERSAHRTDNMNRDYRRNYGYQHSDRHHDDRNSHRDGRSYSNRPENGTYKHSADDEKSWNSIRPVSSTHVVRSELLEAARKLKEERTAKFDAPNTKNGTEPSGIKPPELRTQPDSTKPAYISGNSATGFPVTREDKIELVTPVENQHNLEKDSSPSIDVMESCRDDYVKTEIVDGVPVHTFPSWVTHNAFFSGCRDVTLYRPIRALDEGVYGKVWLAEDKETGERVALKQFKFVDEEAQYGFSVTTLREINSILSLCHPNIISVREMVIGSTLDKIYMVMDYMPHNLNAYLNRLPKGYFFTQAEIKCMLHQILSGLEHIHSNWILHRDMKSENILITQGGRLMICDFGLARRFGSRGGNFTQPVITLYYRPPELILGRSHYGPAVDVWSVGCIFAEIILRRVLFSGSSEAEVLRSIFRTLGTPSQSEWDEWQHLPNVRTLRAHEMNYKVRPLRDALEMSNRAFVNASIVSDDGIDLLQRMLTYNPKNRVSATEALQHPWFSEAPLAVDPKDLPVFPVK